MTLSCTVDSRQPPASRVWQSLGARHLWHLSGPIVLVDLWGNIWMKLLRLVCPVLELFMAGGQYTKRGYSGFAESVLYGCTASRFKHYTSLIPSHLRQLSCLLSTFLDLLPFISLGVIPVFQPDTHCARMVICILSLY